MKVTTQKNSRTKIRVTYGISEKVVGKLIKKQSLDIKLLHDSYKAHIEFLVRTIEEQKLLIEQFQKKG